jgi:hypothetical protein
VRAYFLCLFWPATACFFSAGVSTPFFLNIFL